MNLIKTKSWADKMDVKVIIVYINKASIVGFHKYGCAELIGKSLLDCHNSNSKNIIQEMLIHPFSNTYAINKNNEKRMIHQFPWMENGEHKGIIEMSFDLPADFEIKDRT